MRKLLGIFLILVVFVAPVRAAIYQNYYTTNQTPVTGGQATNIFVGKTGLPTITTNVAGSIYTVNLSAATVGAVTSSNSLSAASATNASIVTNSFVVRISSRGIANGTSTVLNDGANFGPDTVGTTTSGIQEAYDSFSKGTNYGPYMQSMTMQFTEGTFFFTNTITISNLYTSVITLEGASILGTTLVYAGSGAGINAIQYQGGDNPNVGSLDLPLQVVVRDMTISALTQQTNILLYVSGSSYTDIERINFTGWNVRTNQATGSGVSMFPDVATIRPGLVGMVLTNNLSHNTTIKDCFFAGLAVGALVRDDHVAAGNLKFALISSWTGGGGTNVNLWPSNHIMSVGAGIIRVAGYDSLWSYGHAYAAHCAFALIGADEAPKLDRWHFENLDHPIVSDTTVCPRVVDPESTTHTAASWDAQILRTPTSSAPSFTTNYYQFTSTAHPYGVAYGNLPYVDTGNIDFFVNRANTNMLVVRGDDHLVYAPGLSSLNSKWGITEDGAAYFQNNSTTFYTDGSIQFPGIHFELGNQTNNGAIKATNFLGWAIGLTNGSPNLATNAATATDGMALVKRGDRLKLETISGSLPADTSTSSLLTNSASNVKGWLPIASLPSGGSSTNTFFVTNSASSTGAWTNSYGDSWERRSGGVYNALVVGTNAARHTVITDDVSEFANGTWVDTSSSGFFFGKVAPSGIGGVAGDLSFGRGFGTTLDTTGDVTVGGNVPVTGLVIGNGRSLTNIPIAALYSPTNTWGSQTFDFNVAEATTNMAAAITITGLVNTGVGKTNYDHIVRYILASGSDRTFTPSAGTFVNGVAGAPAFVCTNGQLTTISVTYQGGNFTNLTHLP